MRGDAPDASRRSGRPSWRETLTDPTISAILVYTGLALATAIAAYLAIFSQFASYDDEGTLLVTLKAFANGDALYRDIYSPYGPFYYELFGGLFSLSGQSVTTDASRTIVVVVWVLTSFVNGIAVQRLTGRLVLGAAAMLASFGALAVLINEPMHPHGLAILLIATFTLLAVQSPGRRVAWGGAAAGAVLGALVLTKVNLGGFAVVAVVLAAILTVEPFCRMRWLRWLAVAGFLVLPILIMERDFGTVAIRELALLEVLAGAALLVAAWRLRGDGESDDVRMRRWLLAAAAGFAVACAAIMVAILLTGPSLGDVYDGTVREAMRVRDVLLLPLGFPPAAVDWGVAAVAAAAIAVRIGPWGGDKASIWSGLLRAVAGIAIWYSITRITLFALSPSAGNPVVLPMVLAWIAAIPPQGVVESTSKRFLRVLLPALALAESLQVYPVAGSQMGIAAATFVPVGALILADALTELRAWSAARGESTLTRFGVVTSVLGIALVAQLGLDLVAKPAVTNFGTYRDQPALELPGASQLHLPVAQAEPYEQLVALLHEYGCTTFIGYPNINNLYLWSGIEAPPPAAPGAWIEALDGKRQQRVVDEMKASERPCAIRSQAQAEAWLHGEPPPDLPLVNYVLNDFKQVATAGEFEFAVPK